ncbi:glycosyltransferase [Clostridium perfringens]|uniref:hypothetical protein n=1 Tax=Clostridium perfringens TaxID=1502 RepID=UPI002852F6B4|nr:hypothetical protein [Clostridium perfringens]EJT6340971.1 glycosyltransferase family 2 protein [Clostridium perfringens]EJT6342473.1 glycosyltransferase family 2 protein [Clostridium perfringens]MDZ5048925.1 glycosyltransferase [Clostridium perfringens]CAJ1609389.1 hypothetical protein CLO5623_00810 [Clostridium perfringens]
MFKNIPIIIVEFNSYNRTIKFLKEFLINVEYKNISFIIVDNAPNDENYYNLFENIKNEFFCESIEKDTKESYKDSRIKKINKLSIKHNCKDIEVILVKAKKNYGFAIANNIGAKVAEDNYSLDYIIFSNSDISFYNKFSLKEFTDILKRNNNIALVGPKIIGVDGKRQTPSTKKNLFKRWDFNSLIWPLNKVIKYDFSKDILETNESCFCYRIIGAFMFFDFKKFKEIGYFDEKTFLYAEELIIAEKLINKNYLTYYDDNQVLIHEQGGTTKKSFNNLKKLSIMYNSEIYYYKNYLKYSDFRLNLSKALFNLYLLKIKLVTNIKLKYEAMK